MIVPVVNAVMVGAGMVRRRELQAALEEGIARSEFTLNYQPIVELDTGVIKGFEALRLKPDYADARAQLNALLQK